MSSVFSHPYFPLILKVTCFGLVQFLTELFYVDKNVNTLNAANNSIGCLSEDAFTYYNQLGEIILSSNLLTEIPVAALSNPILNLNSLASLDLSYNLIASIPSGSFESMPALTYLNLSHNQIASVDDRVFANLTSILWLDLSFNHIRLLNSLTFVRLNSLISLNVSFNLL